jgi:hypothetical protein
MNSINVKELANTSFNQDSRHESLSSRYQPICAKRIAEMFQDQGLIATSFKAGQAIDKRYEAFQRTTTMFQAPQTFNEGTEEAYKLNITLRAPHLGRGAYEILLGTYRLVCSNGLFVGSAFGIEKVKHLGDVESLVSAAISKTLERQNQMHSQIEAMKKVELTDKEILQFKRVAAGIRLDGTEGIHYIDVADLDYTRRNEDNFHSLWHVFNRIQESIVKYGVTYVQERKVEVMPNVIETKLFNCKARALKPLANNTIEFNQKLWSVAADLIGA